ncbi:lytic murein transglycosylase, partial [Kribbella sp. NPDC002412]
MVTLAALAPLSGRSATVRYDAAGAAPVADPFIEDEVLAEYLEPEQLKAVPAGPGRVAKPVQLVLAGAPVIKTLGESGIPDVALRAYKQAEARLAVSDPACGVPWTLLAAIGRVESNHGRFGGAQLRADGSATRRIRGIPLDGRPNVALIRDTDNGALDGDTTYDRAVGPMQFIPSTWRAVNADANGDGFADPNNLFDATQGAAQYLCTGTSNLTNPTQAAQAVRRYNNATSYVRVVLALARMYQSGRVVPLPSTGDAFPNDPTDPPAANPWPTNALADRPWRPIPWPTKPATQPASRPQTTTPPSTQPNSTTLRRPTPPNPTTSTQPTPPTPTQSRPSNPTRPSNPNPTTTPSTRPSTQPSAPPTTRPPAPPTTRPSAPPTTRPSAPPTTRPSDPTRPTAPDTTQPPAPDSARPATPSTTQPPAPDPTRPPKPKPSNPGSSGPGSSGPGSSGPGSSGPGS